MSDFNVRKKARERIKMEQQIEQELNDGKTQIDLLIEAAQHIRANSDQQLFNNYTDLINEMFKIKELEKELSPKSIVVQ